MSKALTVQASATAAQVRAFAAENGIEVGTRGRLNPAAIKAYNKVHGLKYREGKFVKTTTFKVRDSKGHLRTRQISPKAARALLVAEGFPVGKRGRVSAAAVQAAVDLTRTV